MKKSNGTAYTVKKRGKLPYIIIIVCAAAVLAFALFNIIGITNEYSKGREIYTKLESYITISEPADISASSPPEVSAPPDTVAVSGDTQVTAVDFSALRKINPDIIGWIDIPGAGISYPVVLGRDNAYYLSHSAERTENKSGAIFIDMANNENFSDQNTVIYGHNMNDGSMFAGLHKYEDAKFFAGHPYINIYLADGSKNTYEIISAYVAQAAGTAYSLSFTDEAAFTKYKQAARERSAVKTQAAADGNIITLSTCIKNEQDTRYVVVAALT